MKHYVFGYGSLIDSESRARTAQALGSNGSNNQNNTMPVRLWNWERLWNLRGYKNSYLGVHPARGCSCVGVLFELPSSNNAALEALDHRERGYTREKVPLEWLETVNDLLVEEECDDCYKGTFLETAPSRQDSTTKPAIATAEVCVWIYVPRIQARGMARPETPILQSYVDVCLKGCLSISQAFAKEFVQGTYGWYPGHSNPNMTDDSDDDNGGEDSSSSSSSCWIDDRADPKYIRANKEYALQHAKDLDAVFDPVLLRRRN